MFELRILSGLHRGAALPLDDQPQTIGASEDADVVLVDPGIEAHHATLSRTETGWLLAAVDGTILTAESNQLQRLVDLASGDFVRLGKIWMTVVEQMAKWENPPPEPIDERFDATAVDVPLPVDADSDMAAAEARSVQAMQNSSSEAGPRKRRFPRAGAAVIFVPLAMVAVLSAAAAYAMTAKHATQSATGNLEAQVETASEVGGKESTSRDASSLAAKIPDGKLDADAGTKLNPQELSKAFRKRLAAADLLSRFDLTLDEHEWTMQAALDEEEATRFERILTKFMRDHHVSFPVHAKVVTAEAMLPFKIRQVISGANASVVTQDGERLYLGDEYRGVKMIAIQDNHLTFFGKRKIDVNF